MTPSWAKKSAQRRSAVGVDPIERSLQLENDARELSDALVTALEEHKKLVVDSSSGDLVSDYHAALLNARDMVHETVEVCDLLTKPVRRDWLHATMQSAEVQEYRRVISADASAEERLVKEKGK